MAGHLGERLAEKGMGLVYGGGGRGLMGSVADGFLRKGGAVTGVIPHFMVEREWAHRGISDLRLVETMHQRKKMMVDLADTIVALPGGCGTFEEILEAITWKRLGLHDKPIFLLNWSGFYQPLVDLFRASVHEGMMNESHLALFESLPDLQSLENHL